MSETNNSPAATTSTDNIRRWAELAEKNPNDLRREIASATMEDLDKLAGVILDVVKKPPSDEAKKVIQERLDQIKIDYHIDKYLEELEKRGRLARVLGLQGKSKEPPSSYNAPADYLRYIADGTKDIPVLNWITGFGKDMDGRKLERSLFGFLALPAKLGNQLTSILGVTGMPGLVLSYMGGFGEKKIGEMDIEDGIKKTATAGENITFGGISSEGWTQWKALVTEKLGKREKMPSLETTTKEFIQLTREEQSLDGASQPTIAVTMEALLDIDTLRKRVEGKRTKQGDSDKEAKMGAEWKPADVAAVKIGTGCSAKKEKGRWIVTAPADKLDAGKPVKAETRILQEAIAAMPLAESVTIVTAEEPRVIDLEEKDAKIPLGTDAKDIDVMNRVLNIGAVGGLAKIVFARPGALPTGDPLQAEYAKRTLIVSANAQRNNAVMQLRGLEPLLATATDNEQFEFLNGGTWQKKTVTFPPLPAPVAPVATRPVS